MNFKKLLVAMTLTGVMVGSNTASHTTAEVVQKNDVSYVTSEDIETSGYNLDLDLTPKNERLLMEVVGTTPLYKKSEIGMQLVGYLSDGDVIESVKEVEGYHIVFDNYYVPFEYTSIIQMDYNEFDLLYKDQINKLYKEQFEDMDKMAEVGFPYAGIRLTDYEHDLLARLIRAEAGGESLEGQIAVAQVVFNRLLSSEFPNNIHDVVYQKHQFEPTMNGHINKQATDVQYQAIDIALRSTDTIDNALYFYAPSLVDSPWMASLKLVRIIGVHEFKNKI